MASIPSNSKKQQKKNTGIYMLNILTRKVSLRFNTVGSNIQEHISNKLIMNLEGKCSKEGYIKRNSVRVLSYSAGVVQSNNIVFDVSFECLICNPCEGQKIKVIVENITKAGIKANYYKLDERPIIVFITRDHYYNDSNNIFKNVKENDEIYIKVIGSRFQLNDNSISVLAEPLKQKFKKEEKSKRKIKIGLNT
jgi:DNA-directed RNA polymerase subunit E'/Rpb7|tara:strand:+ start:805 stop:1386 length:582 start_codon:yes stop_codon:yes gene_type:complete